MQNVVSTCDKCGEDCSDRKGVQLDIKGIYTELYPGAHEKTAFIRTRTLCNDCLNALQSWLDYKDTTIRKDENQNT